MAKASGGIDLQAYNKASQEATNYLSFDSQTGLTIGQANLNSKVNISSGGIKLYDEDGNVGTEIKSGFVQVGQSDDGHTTIQEDGMDIYGGDGTEQLAHIGYDDGNALSGTATAPFYTFGTRASGSEIGNYSFVNGVDCSATEFASHAEGFESYAGSAFAHAEGYQTAVEMESSPYAHAEGYQTEAMGEASHTEGVGTKTNEDGMHAEGKFNDTSYNDSNLSNKLISITGIGEDAEHRVNGFAVTDDGDTRIKGDAYVGCNNNSTGGKKVTSQAQGEVLTVSGVTAQSYKDYAVTFPTPYASTPLVVAGLAGTLTAYGMGMISVAVNGVSTTGFTARVYNASSNDRNVTFRYIAIAP